MSTEIDAGSWLLSVVGIGLVGLVFFSMRYLLEKQSKRIDKVEDDLTESDLVREGLKREYLSDKMHRIVCAKTQAETKLYISKEVEASRNKIIEKIEDNKKVVTKAFADLRKDLKRNGAI